jgi:hypothetical protein
LEEQPYFIKSIIRDFYALATMLGPNNCFVLSPDDKARISLGVVAVQKQAAILMRVEHPLQVPDHDFKCGCRHQLIPSVYAICQVVGNRVDEDDGTKGVLYSGPTRVCIRSGLHDSSTAVSHLEDVTEMFQLDQFKQYMCLPSGRAKPVMIVRCDGGGDENLRNEKVIMCCAKHFVNHDLDAFFGVMEAPGRSAYNPSERRMAPLNKPLAGLVLPFAKFGSHLDTKGKIKDGCEELSKQNFQYAGEYLASLWSDMVASH